MTFINVCTALTLLTIAIVKVNAGSKYVAVPINNIQMEQLSQLAQSSSPFMTHNLRLPRRAKQPQATSYHSQVAQFYRPNHQPTLNPSKNYYDPSFEPSTYKESYDPSSFEPSFEPSSYNPSYKQPANIPQGSDHENAETRFERQSGGGGGGQGSYVDFGAHTGNHGSFGWYADFPAHKDS